MLKAVYAVKKTAAIAKFRFSAGNTWVDGSHNRTSSQNFNGVGAEDTSSETPFIKGDAPMELDSQEKRRDARFPAVRRLSGPISTNRKKHNARMLNYSQTGACFECFEALINGATIMVRLEAYRAECEAECKEGEECPWPRLVSIGEVKWCRDFPGIGAHRFGVGVKFHVPV